MVRVQVEIPEGNSGDALRDVGQRDGRWHRSPAESRTRRRPHGSRPSPDLRREQRRRSSRRRPARWPLASLSGGVKDTSTPSWFAPKSRSPKETAETLFATSASAMAAGIALPRSQGHVVALMVRVQVQIPERNSGDALRDFAQRNGRWHRFPAESSTRRRPHGSRPSPDPRWKQRRRPSGRRPARWPLASPSGGAKDTSTPSWFASKSRSPKETAETLFETSASPMPAGIALRRSQGHVVAPMVRVQGQIPEGNSGDSGNSGKTASSSPTELYLHGIQLPHGAAGFAVINPARLSGRCN